MRGLEEKGLRALELARRELDFARTAQDAPSSKDILRKSQTFVPMAPPQPWGKRLAQTATVVLAATLVFAPWIPRSAVISSINVSFDQVQTETAAQEVAFAFLSELPYELLMGADFQQLAGDDEQATGQLSVRVSGMQRVSKLEQTTREILQKTGSTPGTTLVSPGISVQRTAWRSPFSLLGSVSSKQETKLNSNIDPGLPLAQDIIHNTHLIRQGLADHLASQGFILSDFGLLDVMSGTLPARFDFMITDSWPRNFGITIEAYRQLTPTEQQTVRQEASSFLEQLNLHHSGALIGSKTTSAQPLRVRVVDSSNLINSFLTDRLQAALQQPGIPEVASFAYTPDAAIEQAMLEAIPCAEYEISSSPILDEVRQTCGLWINVTITGQRSSSITDRTIKEMGSQVDFEL